MITIEEIMAATEEKMKDCVINNFENKLKKLRTTIANPLEISDIKIDSYGESTPLSHLANISIPEANQFLITPYNKSLIKDIIKTLHEYNHKYNPVEDKGNIRIALQPLTEDSRKKIIKELHELQEHFKIAIRNIRRTELGDTKKLEHINDDEIHLLKNRIQQITDKYIENINILTKKKEHVILTI